MGDVKTEDEVREARMSVIEASLRLAEVLRGHCPGRHRYVPHRDGLPDWCPDCGFSQSGVKLGVEEMRAV